MTGVLNKRGLIALLILGFLTTPALSFSIGISPSGLNFKDVLKGGHAEATASVSTSSQNPLEVSIAMGGPIKNWIKLDETSFTLEPNSRHTFNVIIEPPPDTPVGTYKGVVVATAKAPSEVSSGMGAVIVTAVEMQVNVDVTGTQILKFSVPTMSVKDTEEGKPIEVNLKVSNEGNVKITPLVYIEVTDSSQKAVKSMDYSKTEILPTKSENILIKVPNDLPIGEYKAKISVSFMNETVEKTLEFKVLERGSISLQGDLVTIKTDKVWASVGELVELTAVFKNTGQLVAPARFKGKVYLEDNLVSVLDSDEVDVPAGETKELSIYYKPERPGRYEVRGWIYYSKKVTDEQFVVLNVQESNETKAKTPSGGGTSGGESGSPIILIGLALVAVILLAAFLLSGRRR